METVHLWRGNDEQRAQRFVSAKTGQFAYFDKQLGHPDWVGKKVLDFGGNVGDLLRAPDCPIAPQDYYCVDVLKEALIEGKKRSTQAHFHHFDCYNCSFNPEGTIGARLPDMGIKFDRILAYSVFTHTKLEEIHGLIEQLTNLLAPGGLLAFTFIDPHYVSWPDTALGNNLQWRLERCLEENPQLDVNALMEKSKGATWCTLIDDSRLYINSNGEYVDDIDACMPYNSFHTAEFIKQQFPDYMVHPPVNGEMQHCCTLGR
jgi:SAM-dependent methyltransferase